MLAYALATGMLFVVAGAIRPVQEPEKPSLQEAKVESLEDEKAASAKSKDPKKASGENAKPKWKPMLPAKGLKAWEVTDFGGQGKVEWDGKTLVLHSGDPMTGLNYTKKDFPSSNYEMRLKARRVDGRDFFCCLTFPVGEKFCSFVAGGWGGSVTGLSSINGSDASENETSGFTDFEEGKWYDIRLRVTDEKVGVWMGDEQIVDVLREECDFDTRIEVFIQQPVGVCSFMTKSEIKDFEWQRLDIRGDGKERLNINKETGNVSVDKTPASVSTSVDKAK